MCGGLLLITAYFWTLEGIGSVRNLGLLDHIGAVAKQFGRPWFLQADVSDTPDSLCKTGWLKAVRGTAVASDIRHAPQEWSLITSW